MAEKWCLEYGLFDQDKVFFSFNKRKKKEFV